jgi:hypothetical protein
MHRSEETTTEKTATACPRNKWESPISISICIHREIEKNLIEKQLRFSKRQIEMMKTEDTEKKQRNWEIRGLRRHISFGMMSMHWSKTWTGSTRRRGENVIACDKLNMHVCH